MLAAMILRPPVLALGLALAAAGCATAPVARPATLVAPGVYSAVVTSAEGRASDAGLAMLKQGGSAADAAIATMLALTVVEPQSSGIGGGGFLVYREPGGAIATIDGRETAPAVASARQFIGPDGAPLAQSDAATGGRSVGVPGNIALAAMAHRRWGRLPWATLFAPAIALAEGYEVTPRMRRFIGYAQGPLAQQPAASALFLTADGSPKAAGSRIANTALAETLRTLARQGPRAFYTGPVAAQTVAAVAGAPHNPTAMTMADMAAYRAKDRPPVCGRYRGYRICGMGPPSSGGVAVLQILKQLEGFDLAALGPDNPVAWHLFAESQRLAYADVYKWQGDRDFVAVPVAGLIDPGYIAARARQIGVTWRIAAVAPGVPAGAPPRIPANDNDVPGTTNFAAADARGGLVTYTSTVERPFGSGLVAGGFVLNNELTDFNFNPADTGGLTANRVQPGKRPRSAMSPTIVTAPDGTPVLAIGGAGGITIIAQVAKAIIAVIDWRMSVQDAIAAPQLIAIGDRFQIEKGSKLEAMRPALEALGHKVIAPENPFLKLNGIERVAGGWRGGADPRTDGRVAGF